ncbi:TOTE conflict system archaeo-eukaryotic primase domain-containing protein [Heyndrickxia coagulans]|uniref:TOTE conflict system archaeo-eukaryotic primase domain-containing protein n=1 Tax=Heyndrickxia coagulans TaxID=1398 RepID=UPI0006286E09|nr:DEAD/DEAH box helicase [Heyndrickxia coagulans]
MDKSIKLLEKENIYLKQLLAKMMHHGHSDIHPGKILTKFSPPHEKIFLYKSLFKGRNDTYAVRWESESGKSGYAPACQYESQRLKTDATRSGCKHRKLLPLTDSVFYEHLSGKKTIGLYPVQKDQTCYFLAFDFDEKSWQEDVKAFINICSKLHIPANIERSRSGNGAHIWLFFSEKVPAVLARKLGKALLSLAHRKYPEKDFHSFDRMFPNQGTISENAFGNLIALPLQLQAKKAGNSVFVDQNLIPYPDQWLYLSIVRKLSKNNILSILNTVPSSIPEEMTVKLKNGIFLKKTELPEEILEKVKRLASFHNPEYYKARANRKLTYGIQKIISCYDENDEFLILPRGCKGQLKTLLDEQQIKSKWIDETYLGETINVQFHGSLTPLQEEALQQMILFDDGVVSAPTGFGKTVLAAAMIAKRQTNTLIIVDKIQLQQQWMNKLSIFLGLSPNEIGQYGGGQNKTTNIIDVATIQSLTSKGGVKSVITQYGQVIVDECHHISAFTFEKVLKNVRARYIFGLSATPVRKDGLHPIIFMQCGQIRFKISPKDQAKIKPFKQKFIVRKTDFTSQIEDIRKLYKELAEDKKRNDLIFQDVLQELEAGRSPIIITERVSHIEKLTKAFHGFVKNIVVLTGKMSRKEKQQQFQYLSAIPDDEERLIIATGKFIGEGFDDARLDTLFLAMPVSWKNTLQQYVGRLSRDHAGKEEVRVYDYVDIRVPLLKNMFAKRITGYKSLGFVSKDEKPKAEQLKLF